MHKIPFEKDDINTELERLKQRRLRLRAERLAREERDSIVNEQHEIGDREGFASVKAPIQRGGPLDRLGTVESSVVGGMVKKEAEKVESRKGWLDWARGR